MKTLNKIILTGLSVLSLNNLYSQEKNPEEKLENSLEKISLKQLIFDSWNSKHSKALENYIPIEKKEIQSDTSRFNMLNPGLKEYLNKIYIIDQKDFFDSSTAGHAHLYGGIICLTENYGNQTFFHETGHLRKLSLDEINSDFSEKWEKIADFKYREDNFYISKDKLKIISNLLGIPVWKDGTIYPKDGCLKPLSGGSISEDIAAFIECLGYEETSESLKKSHNQRIEKKDKILKVGDEELKLMLNLETYLEIYSAYFPLYFADTTDHRYQQKLDLLKEYNFLTNEEHEKLSENLGSLNYLLKQEKK